MAQSYVAQNVPVGEFLADQLMLPMGLAAMLGQTSRFRTVQLSDHSQTHKSVLELFLEIKICTGTKDNAVEVAIS